jgi:hypothetical protein
VMRRAPDDRHGARLRALIVVLWRARLRVQEAVALGEHDLDPPRGSLPVSQGVALGARSAWTPGAGSSCRPGSATGSNCRSGRRSASSTVPLEAGRGRALGSGSARPERASDARTRRRSLERAKAGARCWWRGMAAAVSGCMASSSRLGGSPGALGRQVEPSDDDVLGLGSPRRSAAGQHAGRRKHNALYRSTRRRRPGRVDVLGVKQGQAPEQAALGAAGSVCVAVDDAQRRQRPTSDACSPREGSAVDRLLGGERQPEADPDAPAHRHADAACERGAVADGVAEVASDGLVDTREHVRGEAARGVRACRHDRSAARRGVVGVEGTRAMSGRRVQPCARHAPGSGWRPSAVAKAPRAPERPPPARERRCYAHQPEPGRAGWRAGSGTRPGGRVRRRWRPRRRTCRRPPGTALAWCGAGRCVARPSPGAGRVVRRRGRVRARA